MDGLVLKVEEEDGIRARVFCELNEKHIEIFRYLELEFACTEGLRSFRLLSLYWSYCDGDYTREPRSDGASDCG